MRLEVLISCMNQTDLSIVEKSQLTGDVLIINQAETDGYVEVNHDNQCVRMITTKARGLSNSRNLAIHLSKGDICLLCDDDEVFETDYESTVLKHFERLSEADIIAFDVTNKKTRLKSDIQRVRWLKSLRLSSVQLAFRRNRVIEKAILFDPNMGAGSGNGCGEENKFLWDCLKKGLRIYYVPQTIASLSSGESTWFSVYNETFFYQRGAATRYMMGAALAFLYGIYYLTAKHSAYKENISLICAASALFKGICDNPIRKAGG